MDPQASLVCALVAVLPVLYVFVSYLSSDSDVLKNVPTAGGSSLPILSYSGAFRYLLHATDVLHEGYGKYKGGLFKFAEFRGWYVMVSEPRLIEEVVKAPDDQLSFDEAVHEVLQTDYTLGPSIHHNSYHVPIVRSQLTRSIGHLFPDLHDEIVASFSDEICLTGQEWKKVHAMDTLLQVVCRTSNRAFVGLPLCRDPDFCELNKKFTVSVITGGTIVALFPPFLRSIAARFLTNVGSSINRGVKHLEPLIKERLRMQEVAGGDWADKPNDMLQWLLDSAQGEERTVRLLVLRILTINVGAIHTSAMSLTHALYYLAANPQYIQPLRKEVDTIVDQEGWTKAAVGKMRKLDSFLKEVLRLTGLSARNLERKVVKDFRFSDGTLVPAGSYISVPSVAVHHDNSVYHDADTFNPWRFLEMREGDGEAHRYHAVTTSPRFLLFGHGRHACPGRFFAINELKAMLAYIVTTYDVRMEKEGELPPSKWLGSSLLPNAMPVETALYELLGVHPEASEDDIKKAYRKKAREHHPDKNPDDPSAGQKFQEMAAAYEILSQVETRETYDQFGMDGLSRGGPGGPGGMSPDDIFSELFGGLRFGFDFGPGSRGPRRTRGEDSIIPYEVTLEELYNGKTVKMNMEKEVICGVCKGARGSAKPKPCIKCEGKGWTMVHSQLGPGRIGTSRAMCTECDGHGEKLREKDKCKKCKGKKTVKERKRHELFVERGMSDRQRIVLAGAGDEEPGVPPGDVVFVLKTRHHDSFERSGNDLLTTVHITLSEALLGFSRILIKHLDGRGVHVSSPPGKIIKPGDSIVLRGEGMPVHKSPDQKGNLYVMLDVDMPDEDWLRSVDKAALAQLLPPKKPEMDPRPEIVDMVPFEESDMVDFGEGDEREWEDEDEDEEGFGAEPECPHQ